MLIAGFPAGSFAANCYVLAAEPGAECVIIDPGQDAEAGIEEILAEHRLKPAAVLLSHGHIDHVWSVAPVCGARDIPAFIHPADRELLSDPAKGFPLGVGQQLFGGLEFTEPDDVRELTDGLTLDLVGLSIVVDHRPGHTRGSVTYGLPGELTRSSGLDCAIDPLGARGDGVSPRGARGVWGDGFSSARGSGGWLPPEKNTGSPGGRPPGGTLFSGDLLFAGSIGRTDLPGGDDVAMAASLRRTMELPDETIVLAGHGPQTTIGAERHSNPFLKGAGSVTKGL